MGWKICYHYGIGPKIIFENEKKVCDCCLIKSFLLSLP